MGNLLVAPSQPPQHDDDQRKRDMEAHELELMARSDEIRAAVDVLIREVGNYDAF